ncbi:unnamed protein product, partial [Meganyctiphanes norvegica]
QAILNKISEKRNNGLGNHALGTLIESNSKDDEKRSRQGFAQYEKVQCIPLYTLLMALDREHVDLISLDVEGAEMGVLRSFPWHKIEVDVWMVEHRPQHEFYNQYSEKDTNFIAW